jgi:hypothetical protein
MLRLHDCRVSYAHDLSRLDRGLPDRVSPDRVNCVGAKLAAALLRAVANKANRPLVAQDRSAWRCPRPDRTGKVVELHEQPKAGGRRCLPKLAVA